MVIKADATVYALIHHPVPWDEENNPVAKMSSRRENLQHYYFLAAGLFAHHK